LISKLSEALHRTLNYGQFFSYLDGELYKFIYGDWYRDDEDEKAATQLHKEMLELNDVLREFTKYINEHYLEVDLAKLNRTAIQKSKSEDKKIEERTKGNSK
jgi:hypothetical protein